MTTKTTWVVVADGHAARVLSTIDGQHLQQVLDHDFISPNPLDHETGDDRPGRAQNSVTGGRHGLAQPDHHRLRKAEFLARIGGVLDEGAVAKRFEKLVLVAPPQALGDLRAQLGTHAAALVSHEVGLDLTHEPVHQLEARLPGLLA